MLILTRNVGESIRIGDDIEIVVAEIRKGAVRLSIKAPQEVRVYREEVYERIHLANEVAAQVAADAVAAVAAATQSPTTTPARTGNSEDETPAK